MPMQLPTIDWDKLIPNLVTLAFGALGKAVYGALRGLLLDIWSSLFFAIPHDLTDRFGPVEKMQAPLLVIAGAGVALALALIGVRTHVRSVTGNVDTLFDHVCSRVLVTLPIISAMPWVIFNSITIEGKLAEGIALRAAADVLPKTDVVAPEQVLALAVAAVLGVRLWFKLAANVVHVAVAVVWAPGALATRFVPESAWIAGLWAREFFGRLIGALLATIAVGVGMGIALTHSGVIVVSLVGGAFLAAADLVDWLTRAPGTSMGGVVGRAAGLAMLAANAGRQLTAGAAGVSPAGATTHMTDSQVARFYGYSSD